MLTFSLPFSHSNRTENMDKIAERCKAQAHDRVSISKQAAESERQTSALEEV